jgi:NADP-dependent 3-hydroxy acid dehydrogenase YdfG
VTASRTTTTTLITGASSGIGRSLAKRIAAGGEPVVVLARRQPLLDSLVEEITGSGGRALAVACDVTDARATHEAVRRVEESWGPVTTLIANAGGAGEPMAVESFSARQVAEVVNLNVIGVANCIEAVLPGMLQRGSGHLVATSSLAAYRGLPGAAPYSAAKAALTNLMESLRVDLRAKGIAVTVIAPGFVRLKPGKVKKNRPFQLELEAATALMHAAIRRRAPYYAFPRTLLGLMLLGWALPAPIYDRIVAGRGPKPKGKKLEGAKPDEQGNLEARPEEKVRP